MSKPIGRPTKYTKDVNEVVLDLMDKGKSIVQVARHLNVARSTIYKWAEDNIEFSDTLTRAKDYSEAYWETEFQQMMYSRESQPQLVRLYMGNRFGWREQDQSVNDEQATPTSVQVEIVDARKTD
jgi:transposase-like protein